LVIGGSNEYSGAPALAALSALRSGVDISIVACPNCVTSPIRSYSPDLIVKGLSDNYINFDDTSKILEISKKPIQWLSVVALEWKKKQVWL
jgi:NAD(P)H-hydrate repair Nnr-like enzyme with NAD(P)H-hydrate dehydratase domain